MFCRFNLQFNLVDTCLAKYGKKEYFPGPEHNLDFITSKYFCAQNSTTCLISDKRKIFVYIHHSLKAMSHFYHNGHTQLLDVCLLCILRMNKRFIRGDLMCHDGIFLEKRSFLYMTLHAWINSSFAYLYKNNIIGIEKMPKD